MLIARIPEGLVEDKVPPVLDAGPQFDAFEKCEGERSRRLAAGVGVQNVRPDIRLVVEQAVQYVGGLGNTARYEPAEDRDVGVRDVAIGDTGHAAKAPVIGREGIVVINGQVSAVRGGADAGPPDSGQLESRIGIDDVR